MRYPQLCTYLADRIVTVDLGHAVRVAIDGPDCAGKSTLADAVAAELRSHRPVVRLSIDDFHHPAATRRRRGELSPDGYYHDSFNLAAIVDEVLQSLGPDGNGSFCPALFDYRRDEYIETPPVPADSGAIILFDGVFLLRPELRRHWDLSIYLDVDPDESLRRALIRDLELFGSSEDVETRYRRRYLPGQALYRRDANPREVCDILINMNVAAHPALIRSERS